MKKTPPRGCVLLAPLLAATALTALPAAKAQTTAPLPVVTISSLDVLGAEPNADGGIATFRVSRSGSRTAALTVVYTLSGSAVNGTDYLTTARVPLSGRITIPAGKAYYDQALSPVADALVEGNEIVTVTIAPAAAYTVGAAAVQNLTIRDVSYDTPTVRVTASDGFAAEPGSYYLFGNGAFRISRTNSVHAALRVELAPVLGTATNGIDCNPLPAFATIPAGAIGVDVPVVPRNDSLNEVPFETVTLYAGPGTGYLSSPVPATLPDPPPANTVRIYNRRHIAPGELALPGIFSDHMVLQRDVPTVNIWGTGTAGRTVTVTFKEQVKSAVVGTDGKWMLTLDTLTADSVPAQMTVTDDVSTIVFNDILVGEVWLGSGQSNMEWSAEFAPWMPNYGPGQVDEETKAWIRRAYEGKAVTLVRVSAKTRDHMVTHEGGWETVNDQNQYYIPALSGVTAVRISETLNVPVGIIVRSVSATALARWVNSAPFFADPLVQQQMAEYKATTGVTPALTGTSAGSGFGNLYREYVVPVIPYTVRGIQWDQGEWGIGYRGVNWDAAMRALINSWRTDMGQGDLFWSATNRYGSTYWLEPRLKQLGVANIEIAETNGLSGSLHPLNKWAYAEKHLANILPLVYGVPYVAPTRLTPR